LDSVYGAFYSPQSISCLTQVVEEEVRAWRERPEEYYAIFEVGRPQAARVCGSVDGELPCRLDTINEAL